VKKELLALTTSVALVSWLSATVHNNSTTHHVRSLSEKRTHSQQTAREAKPGDNHGKGRNDIDSKGHKFSQQTAREAEPGDNRGKDRNDVDGKGHRLV